MIEINNRTRTKADIKLLTKAASLFQQEFDCVGLDLSVALVGDRVMRRLNRDYRRQDKVTDVLSFPDRASLGEIIIDFAQIRRQAPRFQRHPDQELVFMLVHGLLHLIGFDDNNEAKRREMIRRGEAFIRKYDL